MAILLPVLCCCQCNSSIISRLTCSYLSVTDRRVVLLLAVYTGSSTRAVVCAVFGPSAVKTQPFILQNLMAFGRRRDFIALPRSVCHAITINTRVSRAGWFAFLRVETSVARRTRRRRGLRFSASFLS